MLDNPQALALGASLFFGLALVLTQLGLRHMPPGLGALVSIPTSAGLLWLLSPLLLDGQGWNLTAVAIFAGVGVFFPAAVTLLTFEANRRMGPGAAGALGNLAPLFAILLAALLFGEIPRPLQGIGIAIILVGVGVLSLDRRWLDASWPYRAAALPIGAAAIRGLIQPLAKLGLALWPSHFAAVLVGYTVSAAVIASVIILRTRSWPRGLTRSGVLWFACVGICNGGAVLALYAALARGSVILVSPLVATYPLVALALTALVLRNAGIGARLVLGVAMTVLGVALLIGA